MVPRPKPVYPVAICLLMAVTSSAIESGANLGATGCNQSVFLFRTQSTYQMLSEPKTGTTVLDQIARRLFSKAAHTINECNGTPDSEAANATSNHAASLNFESDVATLVYGRNALSFSRMYKHDSMWKKTLTRKSIIDVSRKCNSMNIPAWTLECLNMLPDLTSIKNWTPKVSIVVTVRDPISTALSHIYYSFGDVSLAAMNQKMYSAFGCEQVTMSLAMRYSLANVLRSYGYDVKLLFYEDLRLDPKKYVHQLARYLGLQVTNEIVDQVVEETSIDQAKAAQDEINKGANVTEEMKMIWRGIGDNVKNKHKVRSGEIRGYAGKLQPKTLDYCMKAVTFHLPPELYSRYFGDDFDE